MRQLREADLILTQNLAQLRSVTGLGQIHPVRASSKTSWRLRHAFLSLPHEGCSGFRRIVAAGRATATGTRTPAEGRGATDGRSPARHVSAATGGSPSAMSDASPHRLSPARSQHHLLQVREPMALLDALREIPNITEFAPSSVRREMIRCPKDRLPADRRGALAAFVALSPSEHSLLERETRRRGYQPHPQRMAVPHPVHVRA